MFKHSLIAASIAASLNVAALVSTQAVAAEISNKILGGGATLPQKLYQESGVLPEGFAPYIGVGSGKGKAAFLNNDATQLDSKLKGKNVHWAASDSKLTKHEIRTYLSGHERAWGPLIQLPSLVTSIAIPFNKPGRNAVNFSNTNTLCGVFSGRLREWKDIPGSGRTGHITVVYQSGSSGSTEMFTRFLNANCSKVIEKGTFAITTIFEKSFSGGLPKGAIPAQGNGGVMKALNDGEGRITYASPDFAAPTVKGLDDDTKVARVRGVSPTPANVLVAIDKLTPPTADQRSNPDSWVPVLDSSNFPTSGSGYPILGSSNVIFSQCYANAIQTKQVRDFFSRHYGDDRKNNNDVAIEKHHFAPLTKKWKDDIRKTFLDHKSHLSIGNVNVCNRIGRPI